MILSKETNSLGSDIFLNILEQIILMDASNKTMKPIFEERFKELLGNEFDEFAKYILTPQRKSFRINTNKVKSPSKLVNKLEKKNLKLENVPWDPLAFFVKFDEDSRSDLGNLFEHFLGQIYIQEATSLLPPLVSQIPQDIDDDFKVLDMCAAPGSKTTQIAALMKNKGTLVANELDYTRLAPLKLNLERSGFTNIIISNLDGIKIQGSEEYDRIILDAPCSGSGVIRKSPQTLKRYNPKQLSQVVSVQKKLLQRAFELLKVGGIMTYSTCSLDPEENECVIKWFLEVNGSKASLLPVELEGIEQKKIVSEFQFEKFNEDIQTKTLRVWPHHYDTNGFYVATIKKISN